MITYYKPNKYNSGHLLSVNFTAKTDKFVDGKPQRGDKSFYLSFVKQTGWDEKEGNGTFKDGAKLNAKMSITEMSGILYAIRTNTTLADSFNQKYIYHDGDKSSTTITFKPAFKKEKSADGKMVDTDVQGGFQVSATRTQKDNKDNKETFSINLTFAEAEQLSEYIKSGLVRIFDCLYSEEIDRAKAVNAKNSKAETPAPAAKTTTKTAPKAAPAPTPEPEPEQEETPVDEDDVVF